MKTDANMKDSCKDSQAMTDLSSSQRSAEVSSTENKRRKRWRSRHNAIVSNVNGSVITKDTFSTETSIAALHIIPLHPVQYIPMGPVTRNSHAGCDFCPEDEGKEQNMLEKAAETSYVDLDLQEVSIRPCSVVSNVEHFVGESVSEFGNLNTVQGTNYNSSNPEDNCGYVKNASLMKKHYGIESGYSKSVNYNKAPILLEKEQNMLEKAAEPSNAELEFQELNSRPCSVVANVEHFAEESMSEVVNLNSMQGTNGNSSNPEDNSGYLKNASPTKKLDYYGINSGYSSSVSYDKESMMLEKAAETSNAELDLQEVSMRPCSVVANVEHFVEESVSEVVNLNVVRGTNDNSSNPEDDSGHIKNAIPMKKLDDYGINSGYSNSVNYNREPVMEDNNKDDSHKISDEPLTVGLAEKETKVLRDQVTSNSEGVSEEMKLMIKNNYEQMFVTDASVIGIPEVQLEENNGRKLDDNQITRHDKSSGDVVDLSLVSKKVDHSKISDFSLDRTVTSHSKKKLLVLDVNGLLADFVDHVPRGYKPDTWISRRSVFKRPFCDDFLKFCFDRFHVGVWSSRHKINVDAAIEFLMGKSASKLLFCWNQSHCTMTNFSTVEKRDKPLVLKELRKLWEKLEPGLPWEKGEFNESNTLLLDDSPHKALLNPMNTAIFPYSYQYSDVRDSSLGPGGDLRTYLEGLAMAKNVQEYVASNPFGQRAIRESNPSWRYYRKVIDSVDAFSDTRISSSHRE